MVSLSKINAWKSCAAEIGMSNQFPNHQGLDLNHPFSTSALNANSKLLVTVYIARVARGDSCGAIPNKNPAKLAPTAGAYLDVSSFAARGLRSRNAWASSLRRFARNRTKKRYSSRCKSRTRDNESESRRVRNRCGGPFGDGLHSVHDLISRGRETRAFLKASKTEVITLYAVKGLKLNRIILPPSLFPGRRGMRTGELRQYGCFWSGLPH